MIKRLLTSKTLHNLVHIYSYTIYMCSSVQNAAVTMSLRLFLPLGVP